MSKTEFVMVPRAVVDRIADHCKFWKEHPYLEAISDIEVGLRAILAKPAEQHQGEPVALPARKADPTEESDVFTDAENSGFNACLDEIAKLGPLYTHADAGEVERLRDALVDIARKASESRTVTRRLTWIEGRAQSALEGKDWAKHVFQMPDPLSAAPKAQRLRAELADLRKLHDSVCAQLAERDALLREWCRMFAGGHPESAHAKLRARTEVCLSASAEPSVPPCGKCGSLNVDACKTDGCWFEKSQGAPVERDERAAFEKAVVDKAERFHPNLEQYGENPDADYRDASIEWAWGLWQARAAPERKA